MAPTVNRAAGVVVIAALAGMAGLAGLAGCPRASTGGEHTSVEPAVKRDAADHALAADDAGSRVELPPAPPLPRVPAGLPPLPAQDGVTPELVALGELLFWDTRLSSTGKLACATCHDPAHGFSGAGRQLTADGAPNLRRAPALVNLAWATELGWDGRLGGLDATSTLLDRHARGQLGRDLGAAIAAIADLPLYRAHLARLHATAATTPAALAAYVRTRYSGDSAWDRIERTDRAVPEAAQLRAGYALFTGKAQCSTCHAPPLYTDLAYHRLGLIAIADEGRGKLDPKQAGAFRTPTLRGAARRTSWFHDGSATSLAAAIDWHLAGGTGQGADRSIVELHPIALTADERAQLLAFVTALVDTTAPPLRPPLP